MTSNLDGGVHMPRQRSSAALAWAVATALVAGACSATTGGGTPRPFPMPGSGPVATAGPEAGSPVTLPGRIRSAPAAAGAGVRGFTVIGTALDLRGIQYRWGGSDLNGFDCSGFTQYVFARHGVSLPREVRDQYRAGRRVGRRDIRPGDLLFFTTTEPGASHVAIALDGDEFVHAPSSTGVVRTERLSGSYWSRRFVGARRVE